jgi:hypothetical protein
VTKELVRLVSLPGVFAAASGPRVNSLTKLALVVPLGLLLAIPCVAQKKVDIWTGVPIKVSTLTLHVGGKPINVYEFTLSVYPMNTPPPWPIGLWLYNYVEVDPDSPDNNLQSSWGQANWCRWWFLKVAALEIKNKKQLPYPYFELNLPADVQQQIVTDEQISVYPSGSVTCWQADNDYAP